MLDGLWREETVKKQDFITPHFKDRTPSWGRHPLFLIITAHLWLAQRRAKCLCGLQLVSNPVLRRLQIFQRSLCDGNCEAQTGRPAAATILKWPRFRRGRPTRKHEPLRSNLSLHIPSLPLTQERPAAPPPANLMTSHCTLTTVTVNAELLSRSLIPQRKTGGSQQIRFTRPVSPVFLLLFKTSPELINSL